MGSKGLKRRRLVLYLWMEGDLGRRGFLKLRNVVWVLDDLDRVIYISGYRVAH